MLCEACGLDSTVSAMMNSPCAAELVAHGACSWNCCWRASKMVGSYTAFIYVIAILCSSAGLMGGLRTSLQGFVGLVITPNIHYSVRV